MMSTVRFRRLWLITCLLLLGGLTTVVPVNCVCDMDQHWGQAVHPLFEHFHGDGHNHTSVSSDSGSLAPSNGDNGAAFTVSEHGSFLGVVFDGMLSGLSGLWLTLWLFPLLTLLPAARLRLSGVSVAPPSIPPRPLFI
jgi:hypothetical protein